MHVFRGDILCLSQWTYLIRRVFTGEHPGPVGFHGEVPTTRGTAVQVGPGNDGPAHVAEGVLLREGGRSRGVELLVGLW